MSNKLNIQYDITPRIASFNDIGMIRNRMSFRLLCFLLAVALFVIPTGCATFSNHMSGEPDRIGAPPYADDPEGNGNPEKAWYN